MQHKIKTQQQTRTKLENKNIPKSQWQIQFFRIKKPVTIQQDDESHSRKKVQTAIFNAKNMRVNEIAKRIGCHKSTNTCYFLLPRSNRERTVSQRVNKLTERDTRWIVQIALYGNCSGQELKRELNLNINVCQIPQVLPE